MSGFKVAENVHGTKMIQLFPQLRDGTGSYRAWSRPPLRFVSVEPIDFPDWFCTSTEEVIRECEVMQCFVEACTLSLMLVEEINPTLYTLELYVVRQYFVVVALRFEQCVKERVEMHGKSCPRTHEVLQGLRACLDDLGALLAEFWPMEELSIHHAPTVAKNWLVMTMFQPVFAALASTFDPATIDHEHQNAFAMHVQRSEVGKAWYKKTHAFRPSAILMGFTDGMVGTSKVRWQNGGKEGPARRKRRSIFESWDEEVREAGMAEQARELLRRVRETLAPLSVRNEPPTEMSWEETLAAGSAALTADCAALQVCRGKVWLTVDGAALAAFGQCPACRIKYAQVQLLVPNQEEHERYKLRLGANWGQRKHWQHAQCAEDDMFCQIFLLEHAPSLPDAAVIATAPKLAGPEARVAENR